MDVSYRQFLKSYAKNQERADVRDAVDGVHSAINDGRSMLCITPLAHAPSHHPPTLSKSLTLPHSLTLSPVRYFTATTYASAETFVDAREAPGSSPWPRRVQRSSVFEIPSRPWVSKKKKTNGLIHRHSLDLRFTSFRYLRLISFRSTMGYAPWGGYAMTWGFVALMNYMTYIILHLPL